jgi:hypothetical protein
MDLIGKTPSDVRPEDVRHQEIPAEVWRIVTKATAPREADRFATVDAMKEEISAVLRDLRREGVADWDGYDEVAEPVLAGDVVFVDDAPLPEEDELFELDAPLLEDEAIFAGEEPLLDAEPVGADATAVAGPAPLLQPSSPLPRRRRRRLRSVLLGLLLWLVFGLLTMFAVFAGLRYFLVGSRQQPPARPPAEAPANGEGEGLNGGDV